MKKNVLLKNFLLITMTCIAIFTLIIPAQIAPPSNSNISVCAPSPAPDEDPFDENDYY